MSEAPRAVFLSYASQDAEAAQRLTEALRAEGLEVWFDQSELRGGDAWDQKIRRQIKDCALFIPLVSANTNARAEGYFRLEWKLAVDRSHLMADDAAFIVPVAIDATSDEDARAPDRFREVQWMRLGKHTPEEVAARVKKLLSGEEKPAARAAQRPRARIRPRYVWPFVGIAIALFFAMRPWSYLKPEATTVQVSEAATLAQRALDVTKAFRYTRDTLALAGDAARKASELDPRLASAWGARARVEAVWIYRNWDSGMDRRRAADEFARKATAIDPDEPNALFTQATVLRIQGAGREAEATLLRRALKAAPNDNIIRRSLAVNYSVQGRVQEANELLQEALRRAPRDPLNHYHVALELLVPGSTDKDSATLDKVLGHFDKALELEPLVSALVWKAVIQASWKNDFEAAHATLARLAALPHEEATEERAIFHRTWIPLLDGKPARALEAAALTTAPYFSDGMVAGPVAWLRALAHQRANRASAALEEWRAAEAVLRARLAASPDSLRTQGELAVTLAMLGRKEEAAKQFARYDSTMVEQGQAGSRIHLRYFAAMGDATRTVGAAREARKATSLYVTSVALARDPWFDRVREHPEFKALLREIARK